jgi:hypothetical protein
VYIVLLHTFVSFLYGTNGEPESGDIAVGTATGYRLDDKGVGVRVPVGARLFPSPCRLDRLWGPPSLLYNGYRGFFPPG